jgi:hypothetical protein
MLKSMSKKYYETQTIKRFKHYSKYKMDAIPPTYGYLEDLNRINLKKLKQIICHIKSYQKTYQISDYILSTCRVLICGAAKIIDIVVVLPLIVLSIVSAIISIPIEFITFKLLRLQQFDPFIFIFIMINLTELINRIPKIEHLIESLGIDSDIRVYEKDVIFPFIESHDHNQFIAELLQDYLLYAEDEEDETYIIK